MAKIEATKIRTIEVDDSEYDIILHAIRVLVNNRERNTAARTPYTDKVRALKDDFENG